MEVSSKEISNLRSFCVNLIRGNEHLDADDIVQDCILSLMEDGAHQFLAHDAKKRIAHIVQRQKQSFVSASFKPSSRQVKESTKVLSCKKCNEQLPSTAFSVDKRPGKNFIKLVCKKCLYKAQLKKRQTTADLRIKYNLRLSKWREDNKSKHKKWNDASQAFNKENLTDSWCRKYIRHKYSREHIDANPHLIQEVRDRLLLKRKKKDLGSH